MQRLKTSSVVKNSHMFIAVGKIYELQTSKSKNSRCVLTQLFSLNKFTQNVVSRRLEAKTDKVVFKPTDQSFQEQKPWISIGQILGHNKRTIRETKFLDSICAINLG